VAIVRFQIRQFQIGDRVQIIVPGPHRDQVGEVVDVPDRGGDAVRRYQVSLTTIPPYYFSALSWNPLFDEYRRL
jgi:hypothetical protein